MTDLFTTPSMRLTQVDAGAIERELARLWSAATKTEQTGGVALMRACVFNLVVLTDAAHVAPVTNIIARLTVLRPHRAIVAALDGDDDATAPQPRLEAWVQAHCTLAPPGRPQVCGEQITIVAPRAAGPYIPGIVLSLLEPDVPVVLWWTLDRLPDHALLASLQPVADRLILDTARMPGGVDALHAVQALIDAGVAVGDFVWGRLTPWREQIAQLFDAPLRSGVCDRLSASRFRTFRVERLPRCCSSVGLPRVSTGARPRCTIPAPFCHDPMADRCGSSGWRSQQKPPTIWCRRHWKRLMPGLL